MSIRPIAFALTLALCWQAPRQMMGAATGWSESSSTVSQVYRVVGKVRILFIWVGTDDLGSARFTRSREAGHRSLSLLIGSDPQRAPRRINEWGYIRESSSSGSTSVFGLRTLTDGKSPDEAEAARHRQANGADTGVVCSRVAATDVQSMTTTVSLPAGTTYHDLADVIGAIEQKAEWNHRDTPQGHYDFPGFLTAVDHVMQTTVVFARRGGEMPKPPTVSYVYRDTIYDLVTRRIEPVAQLRVGGRQFDQLIKVDMAVVNQRTRDVTSFQMTFGTSGPMTAVPVHIRYQPNWWLKIELAIDDPENVPQDPATDSALRARMEALCK